MPFLYISAPRSVQLGGVCYLLLQRTAQIINLYQNVRITRGKSDVGCCSFMLLLLDHLCHIKVLELRSEHVVIGQKGESLKFVFGMKPLTLPPKILYL